MKLANLDTLIQRFNQYCDAHITDEDLVKSLKVDTKIYAHERENDTLAKLDRLAPFGEGNEEPIFLVENIDIKKVEKVGNNGKSHLKIHGRLGNKNITSLFR